MEYLTYVDRVWGCGLLDADIATVPWLDRLIEGLALEGTSYFDWLGTISDWREFELHGCLWTELENSGLLLLLDCETL